LFWELFGNFAVVNCGLLARADTGRGAIGSPLP